MGHLMNYLFWWIHGTFNCKTVGKIGAGQHMESQYHPSSSIQRIDPHCLNIQTTRRAAELKRNSWHFSDCFPQVLSDSKCFKSLVPISYLAVFDGIQRYCNTLVQPYGNTWIKFWIPANIPSIPSKNYWVLRIELISIHDTLKYPQQLLATRNASDTTGYLWQPWILKLSF